MYVQELTIWAGNPLISFWVKLLKTNRYTLMYTNARLFDRLRVVECAGNYWAPCGSALRAWSLRSCLLTRTYVRTYTDNSCSFPQGYACSTTGSPLKRRAHIHVRTYIFLASEEIVGLPVVKRGWWQLPPQPKYRHFGIQRQSSVFDISLNRRIRYEQKVTGISFWETHNFLKIR